HPTESANVVEFSTKPVLRSQRHIIFAVLFRHFLHGTLDRIAENLALLDEDAEAVAYVVSAACGRKLFYIVAHFAFQADIRNDAAIGVWIEARHVACI